MNTKINTGTSRIAKSLVGVLIAGVAATAAPQANAAALPKCNSARKGQIVGTQVCSVKRGVYRWVKVVAPPAAAPTGSGSALPAVDAQSAIPAGFSRHSAGDGSWTVAAPDTWRTNLGSAENAGGKLFFAPTPSTDSFVITTTPDKPKSPETVLAEMVDSIGPANTVTEQTISTLNGLPLISVTSYLTIDPKTLRREMLVLRNSNDPRWKNTRSNVSISVAWYDGGSFAGLRKSELNKMLASVTVTP
jgi:hypothetical protein